LATRSNRYIVSRMSTIVQSRPKHQRTGRTIRTQSLFGGLPKSLQSDLSFGARKLKFADGQIIQHRGDPPEFFFVIQKGHVKLGQYNAHGDLKVLVILGPGDSFGELACLGDTPRAVDAEAAGDAELILISANKLSAMMLASPQTSQQIIRLLAVLMQEALDTLLVYRKMPAPQRLAKALVSLCEGRAEPVILTIRHQELAELVGVSRMSISKTLERLEVRGFLTRGYSEITIADPAGLKRYLKDG
jgi:CRP/FNR family transcriptional regulator, cyclic AMP receptor protein